MVSIPGLPKDVFLHLVPFLDFRDLASLMCTSRDVHDLIEESKATICRTLYLQHLDAPLNDLDWVQEVKDIALLSARVRDSPDLNVSPAEALSIGQTMLRLAKNASPAPGMGPFSSSPTHLPSRNALFLCRLLENAEVREVFLYVSGIYTMAPGHHRAHDTFWDADVAISHLHCLYGRVDSIHAGVDSRRVHAYTWAEMKAYNPLEYTRRDNWGPFMDELGGAVNWTRVEASMLVLAKRMAGPEWDWLGCMTREPPFSGSYRDSSACPRPAFQPQLGLDEDPYGITGSWTMVMSALQIANNMFYQFSVSWPTIQNHFKRQTVTRVSMNLRVTATENTSKSRGLPTAHFEGSSTTPIGTLDIKGNCCVTAAGEVRWRLVCLRSGTSWKRIEAVQIGGVRSGRGAVGNWCDAPNNTQSVGPAAIWKTL